MDLRFEAHRVQARSLPRYRSRPRNSIGKHCAVTGDLPGVSGLKWRRPLAETNAMVFRSWRCLKWAFRYTGRWRTSCHTRQGHDGAMNGELRMEAAVERSTITSKPGVETLARTAISPRGGSRAHKTA